MSNLKKIKVLMYSKAGDSPPSISEKTGVPLRTVRRWLDEEGLLPISETVLRRLHHIVAVYRTNGGDEKATCAALKIEKRALQNSLERAKRLIQEERSSVVPDAPKAEVPDILPFYLTEEELFACAAAVHKAKGDFEKAGKKLKLEPCEVAERFDFAVSQGMTDPLITEAPVVPEQKPYREKVDQKGRLVKIPFSEDEKKVQFATPDECREEVIRVQKMFPNSFMTRQQFRTHSHFADSAWNRHFGTFEEMRSQAGLQLTRHQKGIERAIAKHASVDGYRAMNEEKAQWSGKYQRPSGNRFQSGLIISDVHDLECDPFVRRLFITTAARVQPEKIVINGDLFDFYEFSMFGQDPRSWDVIGRIRWVHEFLRDLRNAAPNAEIILIEGNHEYRLLRHFSERNNGGLAIILNELHGLHSFVDLMQIKEFEINYHSNSDLSGFSKADIMKEVKKNWTVLWDCVVAHHFPEVREMGMPCFWGHHHKHIVYPKYSPIYGSYEMHQLGAGHSRIASYCNGEKWSNGFLMIHCDTHTKKTQFDYVEIRDFVMIGGTFYQRNADEMVPDIGRVDPKVNFYTAGR